MDRTGSFLEAWIKVQKEILEHWVKSQKEFMEHWLAAMKKMQESLLTEERAGEGEAKEAFDLYRTWLGAMVDSTRVMTEETAKAQETWKNAIERQMDLNRELAKNFSGLFTKETGEK